MTENKIKDELQDVFDELLKIRTLRSVIMNYTANEVEEMQKQVADHVSAIDMAMYRTKQDDYDRMCVLEDYMIKIEDMIRKILED